MLQDKFQSHLYAVISDIHGNYPALLAVEKDARCLAAAEGFLPPVFICLGDTVDYGPQPNECVAWLARVRPMISLQGNHDAEAIRPERSRPRRVNTEFWATALWTRRVLEPQHRSMLGGYHASEDGGNSLGDFAFFHGDPGGGDDYLDSPAQVKPYFTRLPAKYCFAAFGHLHYQMLFVGDGGVRAVYAQPEGLTESPSHKCVNGWHRAGRDAFYLINPGSVGQPRFHNSQPSRRPAKDREGSLDLIGGEPDLRAAYMLLYKDGRGNLHYQWRRVEYNRAETLSHLRALAWPMNILMDEPAPQPTQDGEIDPLSDEEMAQIRKELPGAVEKLAKMLA